MDADKLIPKLSIGQSYQGGVIFCLDLTGKHGFIAAKSDQGAFVKWNNTLIYGLIVNRVK